MYEGRNMVIESWNSEGGGRERWHLKQQKNKGNKMEEISLSGVRCPFAI